MISFDENNTRFVLCSVGVLLHRHRVLLHHIETAPYWVLPGGRVEYLENSINAIEREIKEDLNVEIEVEKLLWVVENFFEDSDKLHHELGFYYLLSLPENSPIFEQEGPFKGVKPSKNPTFQWFDLDSLDKIAVFPPFLKGSLLSLTDKIRHIIQKNSFE
jgi:ADP-ribose pyrophosphatase YjhB (NUDIX family)